MTSRAKDFRSARNRVCAFRDPSDHQRVKADLTYGIEESRQRRRLPDPQARRALRKRLGVSQRMVADAVGVSRPTVTRWESGQATPCGEVLKRYLDALALLAAEAMSDPEVHDAAGRRRRVEVADDPCRHTL